MKIVVIGASSGLGAAIAVLHARRGDEVVATGRRVARLASVLEEAASVSLLQNDLLMTDAVDKLEAVCVSADIVYFCAAIIDPAPTGEIMRVNFEVFIELAKRIDRPNITIVAISSLAAVIPFDELPVYCASKAALEAWIAASRAASEALYVLIRPGQFTSELFGRRDQLTLDTLPLDLAFSIMDQVKRRCEVVNLGGPRDRIAASLGPVLGGRRARRLVLGF